jgi:hypothetical protein
VLQEFEVRVYQVNALNAEGALVDVATTDVAVLAIARLQEARVRHLRAWVTDETGRDVHVPDLIARAEAERANWNNDD